MSGPRLAPGCLRSAGAAMVLTPGRCANTFHYTNREAAHTVLLSTLDANGRRRSPVTFPGYRLGMAPANKGLKFPAEPLTRDEVHRLLAACSNRGPSGVRNRAIIETLWRAGLRCAETLALQPKDVNLTERTITVLHGKGDKRRTVSLDPQACAVIERWIDCRRGLGIPRGAPLFCTISRPHAGRPLWASYVREMIRAMGQQAGIDKRCHPHGLRHTMAYELCVEGVALPLIQKQLGHSDLATTARYVDHFAPTDLIRVMGERTY